MLAPLAYVRWGRTWRSISCLFHVDEVIVVDDCGSGNQVRTKWQSSTPLKEQPQCVVLNFCGLLTPLDSQQHHRLG